MVAGERGPAPVARAHRVRIHASTPSADVTKIGGIQRLRCARHTSTLGRIGFALLVIAAIVISYKSAMPALQETFEWARGTGAAGVIVFILLEWGCIIVCFPTSLFELGAGVAFGHHGLGWATLISVVGKAGGAAFCFFLSHQCCRSRIEAAIERRTTKDSHELSFSVLSRIFEAERYKTMFLIQMSFFPFVVKTYGLSLVDSIGFGFYISSILLSAIPYSLLWAHIGYELSRGIESSATDKGEKHYLDEKTAVGVLFGVLALGFIGWRAKQQLQKAALRSRKRAQSNDPFFAEQQTGERDLEEGASPSMRPLSPMDEEACDVSSDALVV
jgi:uncharacterized membrane protein YdjX (TVP38/TMEM64 family)